MKRCFHYSTAIPAFALAVFCGSSLLAGTVITAGLPANTAIVNVSGTADGAAVYDSTQTYWYQPFNTNNSLLEYTVQPGTYAFRIVDPTDAAALYPALTSTQLSQLYTAWTYNSPWATDYLAFDVSAASSSSEYQLFAGAVTPLADQPGFSNATSAYNAAVNGGYYDQIVSGVGGRYHGATSTEYTFSSAETLIFAVPDYDLADNAGGVSVLISPVASNSPTGTPEPASLLLFAGGMGAITLLAMRRRKLARV